MTIKPNSAFNFVKFCSPVFVGVTSLDQCVIDVSVVQRRTCLRTCQSERRTLNINLARDWDCNTATLVNIQNVALTGRNATGSPYSRGAIIRLEAAWRHRLACAGEAACRPGMECYRRRQPTDDDKRRKTPATLHTVRFFRVFLLKVHMHESKPTGVTNSSNSCRFCLVQAFVLSARHVLWTRSKYLWRNLRTLNNSDNHTRLHHKTRTLSHIIM